MDVAKAAGSDDYAVKPIKKNLLMQILRKARLIDYWKKTKIYYNSLYSLVKHHLKL